MKNDNGKNELYRPRSRGEIAALRRARTQAIATATLILIIIAAAVCVLLWQLAAGEDIPTNVTPQEEESTERTVFLDPGHGGTDMGNIIDDETYESDAVLAYALDVKKILEENGVKVILSRDGQNDEQLTYDERGKLAVDADCAVSFHTCAQQGVTYSLLSDTTETSALLANRLGKATRVNEADFPRCQGVAWVRYDCPADSFDAQACANAILDFLSEDIA